MDFKRLNVKHVFMFISWCANYISTSFERPAFRTNVERSTGFNFVLQNSNFFLSFRIFYVNATQSMSYPHFDTQPELWPTIFFPDAIFSRIL